MQDGAVFNNQAGATFNAQANDQLGVSGSGTFNNLGTFTRSGTGTSRLDVSFNNSSPTQVTGGTLNLNAGGTSSGAFEVGDTAGLQFGGGTYNLNTGATLTGAGIYRLSGGTLSINGAVSVTNFEQTGATFTGNGTFTVSGTMTWTGGYQSGTGATNIAAGATLTLNDSTDYLRQHGRTLNNAGTATWTSSSGYYWYLEGGAVFNNQAGATFNAQANDQLGVSGSGTFNNLGTFTRSGAGTSTIQVPFNNSSPTQVTKGVLLLNAGGTSGGAFQVSAGATLQFGGGTYSLNPGATLSGAGLYGLFNGTVSVSGTVSVTNFEQTGGTLTGAGTFSITSTMDWIGGYQSGTGATNIAAAATLTLNDSTDYLRQHGRTLNNAGTATWTSSSGYYWYLEGGAVFNNQAGATFNAQANDQLGVSGSGTFNNLGTFTRSGVGTSTIQVPFNNSSPTQVVSGTLNLNAGGASGGAFQVSAGAILQFNGGTYNLNPGATLSGAGLYRLSGGTLSVNGAVPVTNFEQTAATLTGSGTLAVSQSMAWTGGAQSGTGATNIAAGATLKLNDTGGYLDQNGRTLNNAGTTDWTTGGGYYWYMQGGAVFNNQAGATFNAQANEQLGVGGGGGTFNNLGTFTRSGAGTSTIQVAFTNNSPTQVMSGTLNLNGGGSSSGAFQVSAGATLQFGGGTHTLAAGSSVTGAGDVTFSGGTVTVNGSYNIPGVTTVSGGTVNLDGATGVVLATFTQTGGTLNLGDASISRNFARTGGTFNHTGTLTFNGADVQGLTLNQATTFNNLTVNAGVILDESVAANNATVAGQLTNLGIIRKTLAIAGPGSRTFGLTEATLNVVVPDQLSSVQVDRRDTNHPNATISQAYGRYWTITPTGGGYTVDVTLPHRNVYHAQAQACRYTGASWDCGRTSSTATTVTRAGVTTLSDWVVGYPPAAVSLAKSAVSNPAPAGSPFTYRFAITNTGPVTATTVVLTDTLPAALKHGLAGNVLMLHLDEPVAATTFQDVSGQGNNGTCTGIACPTAGVSGKFGKAAQFDGVNDVISAGNPAVLRLTGALSLAGWFKTTAPVGNYRALVSKWHTGPTNASYLLGWETGGLRFCLSNGTRMICANSGQAYNNGQWHHVAGTWNGTTATIYVDGAAVNATPDGTFGLVANTTLNVKVGSDDSGSGDRFFNGQIDEVAIYRHALSAAEITAIYQAGIRGWLTTGQGVCAINGELRCDLGEIAAAKTTTVTLQLVAEAATDTVANHACVRAYENDANLNDNCAAATVWFLKRKLYLPIMLRSQ
jgi:uncharacterized repeat protein (TIGR01451 family)